MYMFSFLLGYSLAPTENGACAWIAVAGVLGTIRSRAGHGTHSL